MRYCDPFLRELQKAGLIVDFAQRAKPAGVRTSMNAVRGVPELTDEQIDAAIFLIELVSQIADPQNGRIVRLAMLLRDGEPEFDRAGIARHLRISEATVTRRLRNGLNDVRTQHARWFDNVRNKEAQLSVMSRFEKGPNTFGIGPSYPNADLTKSKWP